MEMSVKIYEVFGKSTARVLEMSEKCPANAWKMCGKNNGTVQEMSWKFPGSFQ